MLCGHCLVAADRAGEMVSHYDQSNWAVHWSAGVLQLYVQRQCTSQPGRTSVTLDQLHSSHCGTRSGQPSCIFNIVSGVISAFASPVWAPRRNAPLIPFLILNIVCLFISYASPLVFFLHFFLVFSSTVWEKTRSVSRSDVVKGDWAQLWFFCVYFVL